MASLPGIRPQLYLSADGKEIQMMSAQRSFRRAEEQILFAICFVFLGSFGSFGTASTKGFSLCQKEKGKETTAVADAKFGKGGTKETTSDEKLRLLQEVWKDKKKIIREKHLLPGQNAKTHTWFFYDKDGHLTKIIAATPTDKGWDLEFQITSEKTQRNISEQELEKIIQSVEKESMENDAKEDQANDDKKEESKSSDAPDNVEPPKLPAGEVFRPKDESEKKKTATPSTPKESKPRSGSTSSRATPPLNPRVATGQPSSQRVSVAQARAQINRHIAHIEERIQQMKDAYYYDGAVKTLEAAFRQNGITTSMSYADSWAKNTIGLAWSQSARDFHDYHREVLKQSLSAIEERGYARSDELAYIDLGMERWDEGDRNIEKLFQTFVSSYVQKAKVYDEKAEYQKHYSEKFHQLETKKPYPSSEIDALNDKSSRDNKAFEDRISQINNVDQRSIEDSINKARSQHVFEPLKKVPAPQTESQPVSPNRQRPKPTTQDDEGLQPPPLPDIIRKKCQASHPEEMKRFEAEEKEVAHLRQQADYYRKEAATAIKHAREYRDLAKTATDTAAGWRRRAERDKEAEDLKRAEKYKNDAEFKEAEAKLDTQKAAELEREANKRETQARQQLLKECPATG